MQVRWPQWGAAPPGNAELTTWRGHKGYSIESHEMFQIIQCSSCILNHVVPLPTIEQQRQYYANVFWQEEKRQIITRYERDREWWRLWHNTVLDLVPAPGSNAPDVLSIGAGAGLFLDAAIHAGYVTTALEPSDLLASRLIEAHHLVAQGIWQDYVGLLEWQEKFAGIMLWGVLEREPCPESLVIQCYDWLKPDGWLAVCVPNDFSVLQYAACEMHDLPHWWIHSDHCNYFTPKMLQLMLRRCGFTICDTLMTYPLENFLLAGRNYIGHDDIGRTCRQERMRYELALSQHGLWYFYLDECRTRVGDGYGPSFGREILMLAQKHET